MRETNNVKNHQVDTRYMWMQNRYGGSLKPLNITRESSTHIKSCKNHSIPRPLWTLLAPYMDTGTWAKNPHQPKHEFPCEKKRTWKIQVTEKKQHKQNSYHTNKKINKETKRVGEVKQTSAARQMNQCRGKLRSLSPALIPIRSNVQKPRTSEWTWSPTKFIECWGWWLPARWTPKLWVGLYGPPTQAIFQDGVVQSPTIYQPKLVYNSGNSGGRYNSSQVAHF